MPVLSSKSFSNEEIYTICRWLNDKRLMRYSEQRFLVHDGDGQRDFIGAFEDPDFYLGIRVENDLVGTLTITTDTNNGVAELGILIGAEHGGRGYGLVAWDEAILTAFNALDVRKVEAGCMSDNDAMMTICQKSGMLVEGWRNNHFKLDDGSFSHMVLWGKLR
jgi:ribosomal-protein-alanine N-acetyltransferase